MTDEKTTAPGADATPVAAKHRGKRQERTGVVTSAKMQKTIVVKVTRAVAHPLYHRVIRSSKKYYAHDENGEARVGDTVRIASSRPLSKLKRWRLVEVVGRSTRVA
ncbi:MAG TPA: 30S ribosomal protein S17 [Candidatus Acidoferrales bacterium]